MVVLSLVHSGEMVINSVVEKLNEEMVKNCTLEALGKVGIRYCVRDESI